MLVLRDSEKATYLISFGGLDNRRDKLSQESIHLDQRWPEVVNKVDNQPFDVGAVVILISHNHDASVPEL